VRNHCIKRGYRHRKEPEYYVDDSADTEGTIWQPEVYKSAIELARYLSCSHIIDIGCGRAHKLNECWQEFNIVGVDSGLNLEYCRENYPSGSWIDHDLETPERMDIPKEATHDSVIICADVIEHLVDPMPLLENLRHLLKAAPVALLSTVERNLASGFLDYGEPKNWRHVREWSIGELSRLLNFLRIPVVWKGFTITNSDEAYRNTALFVLKGNTCVDLERFFKRQLPPEASPPRFFYLSRTLRTTLYHLIFRKLGKVNRICGNCLSCK